MDTVGDIHSLQQMERVSRLDNDIGWGVYNSEKLICEWTEIMASLGLQKTPLELKSGDLLGKRFSSPEKAEQFFNAYARAMGFGVRRSHKKYDAQGNLRGRTWLCAKEGHRFKEYMELTDRKKEAKLLTREGCPVNFRVTKVRQSTMWVVKHFFTSHSHPVASATHVQFIQSNRVVTNGALKTAEAMHYAGIRKCNIMGFLSNQVGGFNNVQFLIKDLYNKMGSSRGGEIKDSDTATAIGYLHHKWTTDEHFYGKFSLDAHNRLENLFWSDSRSRMDYKVFSHTLAFDATYKTNVYGKPLLVLVGVNNHFHTTIFGFCFLIDETTPSYVWALTTFLECMDDLKPSTVITDGDNAMKAAITRLMPNSVHRLCALHLLKNVASNVKAPEFCAHFKRLMYRHYSTTDFDKEWIALLDAFRLIESPWAASMYDKRESWAESFLRGNFFAGMRTTQRSEGMHAYLKSNVKGSVKLLQLVHSMEQSLSWLRHKEAHEDFLSSYCKPITNVTNMTSMEEQAATIYTRRMFFKVRDEMKREGLYLVSHASTVHTVTEFKLVKYTTGKHVRTVTFRTGSIKFKCSCFLYPTKGIPCRHMFATMKHMQITQFPTSLVCFRWTKVAKMDKGVMCVGQKPWENGAFDNAARFGLLLTKSTELCYLASVNPDSYTFALDQVEGLVKQLRGMCKSTASSVNTDTHEGEFNMVNVENPPYSKSKGSGLCGKFGGNKKRCTNCHQTGHNKKTCVLHRAFKRRGEEVEDDVASTFDDDVPTQETVSDTFTANQFSGASGSANAARPMDVQPHPHRSNVAPPMPTCGQLFPVTKKTHNDFTSTVHICTPQAQNSDYNTLFNSQCNLSFEGQPKTEPQYEEIYTSAWWGTPYG